jgi:CRISPR-associated protein Cas2
LGVALMAQRSFYVLAYDVVDDRRRLKVARYLEALGERVQDSVFEAYLTPGELDKLIGKVRKLIEAQEDSLRVYELCAACREKVRTVGRGRMTAPPGLKIV